MLLQQLAPLPAWQLLLRPLRAAPVQQALPSSLPLLWPQHASPTHLPRSGCPPPPQRRILPRQPLLLALPNPPQQTAPALSPVPSLLSLSARSKLPGPGPLPQSPAAPARSQSQPHLPLTPVTPGGMPPVGSGQHGTRHARAPWPDPFRTSLRTCGPCCVVEHPTCPLRSVSWRSHQHRLWPATPPRRLHVELHQLDMQSVRAPLPSQVWEPLPRRPLAAGLLPPPPA